MSADECIAAISAVLEKEASAEEGLSPTSVAGVRKMATLRCDAINEIEFLIVKHRAHKAGAK